MTNRPSAAGTACSLTAAVMLSGALVAAALPTALGDALAGLGRGPHAHLEFLFEVTFMQIDVAVVHAWLGPADAEVMGELLAEGGHDDDRNRRGASYLVQTDDIACGFTFRRDGDFDRFLKGMREGLDKARRADFITDEENGRIWNDFAATMEPLLERGAVKNDQLVYRAVPDGVRLIYLDAEGTVLLDTHHAGDAWSRGIRGLFFCRESRFGKKLVESLWKG